MLFRSPEAGPQVAAHLSAHGPGIHHVAIEVLNADFTRVALADTADLTALVGDAHGHEQFFSVRDPDSGVQLGFIARTGHRVGIAGIDIENILTAFNDE